VEKLEDGKGRWLTLATLKPTKRSYMVERVASDSTTRYRVYAENIHGKGQSVETSVSLAPTSSGWYLIISKTRPQSMLGSIRLTFEISPMDGKVGCAGEI